EVDPLEVLGAVERAALATGGHLPAIIHHPVVRPELARQFPGHAQQLLPGRGIPEPSSRIPARTQEEVTAATESQIKHRREVPVQGPQRLSRVQWVPKADVMVIATGREDLAVVPPRQHANVVRVLERRQVLAIAQVAELNEAVADDGQP